VGKRRRRRQTGIERGKTVADRENKWRWRWYTQQFWLIRVY